MKLSYHGHNIIFFFGPLFFLFLDMRMWMSDWVICLCVVHFVEGSERMSVVMRKIDNICETKKKYYNESN